MPKVICWNSVVEQIDYAFQPIVNTRTGTCLGYEALLRGWDLAGFSSIGHLFDAAAGDLSLYRLDIMLREKAIAAFAQIPHGKRRKLFYNLDNRLLSMPDYEEGNTQEIVNRYGLHPGMICFEVSERHELDVSDSARVLLDSYKRQQFRIALDDFGSGFSGLQQLYHCEPDFIKLDRFFMAGIATDSRKRLFVSTIVSMAHLLGIHIVGEGIENAEELRVCRELSIDFVQGYWVQRPTVDVGDLHSVYPHVAEEARLDRREWQGGRMIEDGLVQELKPIHVDESMTSLFDRFRASDAPAFVVIVNTNEEPLGIVRESDLREYVYTPYGWALAAGHRGQTLHEYVSNCPTVESCSSIEHVMEVFSIADHAYEGVIVTDVGRYLGFASAAGLLKAANERSMALAREQNPLTRLPGNSRINEYLADSLADESRDYAFVYFDFDDFKPFNDTYGFRRGDRAIQLFGDILREASTESGCFIGHVGGDDFFCGLALAPDDIDGATRFARRIRDRFLNDVASLYDQRDRTRGWILADNRRGVAERFPLLGVSAGVAFVPRGARGVSIDDVGSLISKLKKCAKGCTEHISVLEVAVSVPAADLRCRDVGALPEEVHANRSDSRSAPRVSCA